ncbi:hypothetical protein [Marmoricola sp. RAF53]|uniref:hypothetical protein n=1 Tax=Marmoricola sp. RAF53 TaxID=3233059 RepID=UPI003F9DD5AB
MKDHISKAEIRKDALQDGVEAVTHAVGQGTQIVVGAVADIAKTVGGLATDLFEIRDAARRAGQDSPVPPVTPPAAAAPADGDDLPA